jgi:type IX secretion system PorP/SprF family membrane protein
MKTYIIKIIISISCLASLVKFGFAQDIHFSQFFEAPLLRNPALAGIFSGDVRLQTVYRTQWQSVTAPYKTESLNGEYKLPIGKAEDFITIGGQILYDKAGTIAMTSTHILPALNYHKSLSRDKNMYVSLGFMGGLVQRRFDRGKITTNSQFDGNSYNSNLSDGETFSKSSYSYFDGTVGLSFSSQFDENTEDNFVIGVAYHHFNKPNNISFYSNSKNEMTPKWVISGGLKKSTSEYAYVTFQADYTKQGSYSEAIGGMVYTVKLDDATDPSYLIHAGALLRWNDAIIPIVKIEKRPFSISVSYDANISKLKTASKGIGGFELGLSYIKYIERYNSSKNKVRCPKF